MRFSTTISLPLIILFAILLLAEPISVWAASGGTIIEIENPLKYGTIIEIINALTGLLKTIGFGVGLIMVIWGGIQIMAAAGSEERVTKGKKTIMWAVIGYAIVFLVDFIIGFVKELLGAK